MRLWKLGQGMVFVGSKRLGLLDKIFGLWVRGTVGLSVRRVSGIWESFKFGYRRVFRLRFGFRLSVRFMDDLLLLASC